MNKKVIVISAVLLLAGLFAIAYFSSSEKNEAGGFQVFRDHYLGIMKNLNSSEAKDDMTLEHDREYNFTDLFAWEHGKLTFTLDPAGWFEDPVEILRSGKGICAQFSIVTCLRVWLSAINVDLSWQLIQLPGTSYTSGLKPTSTIAGFT
jgi:hypothetical protein